MSVKRRSIAFLVALLAVIGVEAGDWTFSALAQPIFIHSPFAKPAGAPGLLYQAQSQRFNFFDFLFGPSRPRRSRSRVGPPEGDSPEQDSTVAPPLALPKDPGAQRVYVFGDALAAGLANALRDSFSETPTVEIFERTRADSGLVRNDHYDWSAVLASILENEQVSAAVLMIGSNDRQPIRLEDGTRLATRSTKWEQAYITRVDGILRQFSEKNIPVYWVGLPIMRSEGYAQDMAYLNEVYLARAQRAGARFIDTWSRFADEEGHYSAVGPDVNGKIRRLRADNGIYLTPTGNKKLAFFVEQIVGADLQAGGLARLNNLGEGALPGGLRGPVQIELSLTNPGTPPANATLAGGAPEPPQVEPPGALAGETASKPASVAVTETAGGPSSAPPEEAATGLLSLPPDEAANGLPNEPANVSTSVPANQPERARPDYRLLVLGESPPPEPGRADDFSWPRGAAGEAQQDIFR